MKENNLIRDRILIITFIQSSATMKTKESLTKWKGAIQKVLVIITLLNKIQNLHRSIQNLSTNNKWIQEAFKIHNRMNCIIEPSIRAQFQDKPNILQTIKVCVLHNLEKNIIWNRCNKIEENLLREVYSIHNSLERMVTVEQLLCLNSLINQTHPF